MVQEIRHIRFTDREVAAAVTMYLSGREEDPVGSEEIAEIKVTDSLEVEIRLKARRPEQPRQLTLDVGPLAAALFKFCAAKEIPLPRKGKKSLRELCPKVGDGDFRRRV